MKVNLYSLVSLIYICFFNHFCFAESFRTTLLADRPTVPAGSHYAVGSNTRGEEFPKILEPNRTSDVNARMARVVITPVPGAKLYTVELNRKPDFKNKSIIISGEGHDFLFQNLAPSTKYYARAISDISTTYGPVTYFTTAPSTKQTRLWGLTTAGGEFNSGTVFSFSTDSSTFTRHHDYQETSEFPNSYLSGSLVHAPDGGFFGTSECERNGTCANGEAFYISPEGKFELRYSLGIHAGSVTLTSDNKLYVVDDWINYFRGGIWKLNADSSAAFPLEKIIFKFSEDTQGLNPKTSLLEYGDYLYGVTPYGGKHNFGTIFRLNKNGKDFSVLHDFDGDSGANPNGSLTPGPDGYLYGTTTLGGSADLGLLFKILPDGNDFIRLYEFTGLNGKNPKGNLLHGGDNLFGMTSEGGNHDKGVLFSLKINGSSYKKLFDFNGANGANPSGTPTIDDKNNLFGMTAQGGEHNLGVIFRIRTNGSAFSKLFDFSKESGGNPDGDLLFTEDSFRSQPGLASRLPKSADEVGLFPNPFIHTMTAQVPGEDSRPVKFILSDLQGNVLQEIIGETNSDLQLGSALEKGIYILKVVKDGSESQHRIVKK